MTKTKGDVGRRDRRTCYDVAFDDNDVEYGIRELNRSDLMGFTYELGLQVEQPLYKNVKIYGAASFTPEATLNSENERDLETVIVSRTENAVLGVQDHTDIDRPDSDFTMPMAYDASLGLGEKNKWFAGVAYGYQDAKNAYKIKDYKMAYQLWLPLAKKGNAEASCVENSI